MHALIVGGGFCGTMAVVHLLQSPRPPTRITWLEKSGQFGQGIAYGTHLPDHVLNVPMQAMSAWPQRQSDLVDWAREQKDGALALSDAEPLGGQFLPRMHYARYLAERLAQAQRQNPHVVHRIADEAVDVRPRPDDGQPPGWLCVLRGGQRVVADKALLALGHLLPSTPPVPSLAEVPPHRYIPHPWAYDAIAAIDPHAQVAVLGAGLSMVDVVLQLHAQGFAGHVCAVSRRGLLPQTHAAQPSPISLVPPASPSLRTLWQWVVQNARDQQARGGDWRQVIDAMRPHTNALWQRLPHNEQARLLRHGKAYWDAHRHRVAPMVGRVLTQWRHEGRFAHHGGRLVRAETNDSHHKNKLLLTWRLRHNGEPWRQAVDVLINCTGAHPVWARAKAALPRALLHSGVATPGPHGWGLSLGPDGQVLGPDGAVRWGLHAVGPARLGVDFESVAVPELREQVWRCAQAMLAA